MATSIPAAIAKAKPETNTRLPYSPLETPNPVEEAAPIDPLAIKTEDKGAVKIDPNPLEKLMTPKRVLFKAGSSFDASCTTLL